MNDELKPCPFCGGLARIEAVHHRYSDTFNVCCEECGAEIVMFEEQEAVGAWNRRTQ